MTTAPTTAPSGDKKGALLQKFADKYSVDPAALFDTLKNTAFRQRGDQVVSNAQMMALLIVADQYGLNPFTKEIFAYNDKGAIVPVVSVDGWARIINEHRQFNGMEFRYSENIITMEGGKACPEWCEVILYRRDREHPTVVREYLDEVYQEPRGKDKFAGPWQSHTKRMLRHKTLIQGSRVAFGFAGIYDEDEASRIVDPHAINGESREVAGQQAQPQAGAAPARGGRMAAIVQQHSEKVPPMAVPGAAEAVPAGGVTMEHDND